MGALRRSAARPARSARAKALGSAAGEDPLVDRGCQTGEVGRVVRLTGEAPTLDQLRDARVIEELLTRVRRDHEAFGNQATVESLERAEPRHLVADDVRQLFPDLRQWHDELGLGDEEA